MLFRPSFCANCGEKIERAEWSILTSRRFCQVCESEYKGIDLVPRAVVLGGVLIGLFGFGAYLQSGEVPPTVAKREPVRVVEKPVERSQNSALAKAADLPMEPPAASLKSEEKRPAAPIQKPKIEADEPVNYCGAETKKGTPCSRRVKGNTRCYQHAGMPAMDPRRAAN